MEFIQENGAVWAAWSLGAVWPGTLGAIDAGRREGTVLRDGLLNTLRGMAYAAPPAAALAAWRAAAGMLAAAWAAAFLPLAGAMQGVAYELAWRWARNRPTEWAEAGTGGCLGLGAVAAVMAVAVAAIG